MAFLRDVRPSDVRPSHRCFKRKLRVRPAHERKAISARTKAALAAAKARGQKLGNPNLAALRAAGAGQAGWTAGAIGNQVKADKFAAQLAPVIEAVRADGITSLEAIAAELNARGILTARGGQWYATTVRNLLARAPS
jgi:DNA invertase Pin-like site-specific DNA recombinase